MRFKLTIIAILLCQVVLSQNLWDTVYFKHFETHGHNSPIAGHNQEINEISVNKDDTESKSINKKSLNVNRWVLILTAVGIIVVIIVYLLQRGHTT